MALGVGVRVGLRGARAGASMVHSWADHGECGCEVVEGPCERCTRVSNGDGDEFYSSPMLLDGRDKKGVFLGLLRVFLVASEVPGEPNLCEDEDACIFCRSWSGRGRACP